MNTPQTVAAWVRLPGRFDDWALVREGRRLAVIRYNEDRANYRLVEPRRGFRPHPREPLADAKRRAEALAARGEN